MRIHVRRHDSAWEGLPEGAPGDWTSGRTEADVVAGSTVADLLRELAIDPSIVTLITINGRAAELSAALADGDSVDLIPPITGG